MSTTEDTPAANKELVLRFFENLASGRLEAALELMADGAIWQVSGNPEYIPLAGRYSKAEVVELVAMVGAAMPDGIKMTITGTTAEDDRVAVEAEVWGVSPIGKAYDNRNFFAIEARSGRIRAVREYYDTIHTNDVLFNRSYGSEELTGK